MMLRPRQKLFVERSLAALDTHNNTLGIGPTGCGKSILLSAVAGDIIRKTAAKVCIIAHRDELTEQNRAKFGRVNPAITTSVVDANKKSWEGQATFAMVPTLSRPANLDGMPKLDLLVIDEAHHAVADSYRRIIDRTLQLNPSAKVFGVTATPNRGDRQGLRDVFDNVADQIRIAELIASGHLVKPRTFVVNVGVQEALKKVRRVASDFDMNAVAEIMDKSPVTAWCEDRSIPYGGVPVGTWKRHACGKGNASKDEVLAAMRERGFEPADDNEADAISILLWALETNGGLA